MRCYTQQHGPHLPVMTDTRLGQEIAFRAARKAYAKRPVVVTPVVWSGLSEHHMTFGGTLTLSHDTFRRVIRDLIDAITRHGFRDILISNSHGGNIIAMQQILDELAPHQKRRWLQRLMLRKPETSCRNTCRINRVLCMRVKQRHR